MKKPFCYGAWLSRELLLTLSLAVCAAAAALALGGCSRAALLLALLLPALAVCAAVHLLVTRLQVKRFYESLARELNGALTPESAARMRGFVSEPAYCQMVTLLSESIEQEYSRLLLNREAKLNVLQSQINPHFLYNTLDSIRSDVQEAGLEKPAEMLQELAGFFRYSISEKKIIISMEEELKNVDTYMNIMRYRFGSRFALVKYVDAQDEFLMEFQMPKMILQPLIENAINHGLESRLGEGLIVLHANRTDRFVEIVVQDNGVGMDGETLDRLRRALEDDRSGFRQQGSGKGGLALGNVNRRLKLYFGEPYGLSIASTEGVGTEIRILMPLHGGIAYGAED